MVNKNNSQIIFFDRYFKWSLEDWKREIREDYSLIKLVRQSSASEIIKIMTEFTKQQRLDAVECMVRNINQYELPLIEESYSKEDQQFYEKIASSQSAIHRENLKNTPFEITEFQETRKLNRNTFRKCIIEKLNPLLGKPQSKILGGEFDYKTVFGSWNIWTTIDTGGRYHQLTYEQSIRDRNDKILFGNISLFRWLGISGQTIWQNIGDGDIESVTDGFVKIIQHFIDTVQILLEGLNPDDFVDYRLLQRELYEKRE